MSKIKPCFEDRAIYECKHCTEKEYSPDSKPRLLCLLGEDKKCPLSETPMYNVDRPDNFDAEHYEHIATAKAERSGGYSTGDLFYSIDRNKYDLKNVPLETGYYTNGEYLYRVVNNGYNDFTIIVTKEIV